MTKTNILKLVALCFGLLAVVIVIFTDNRGVTVVLSSSAGASVPLSRTGAPLGFGSEPTCLAGGCHEVGPLAGESLSIEVRDSTGTQIVSGYQPGLNYKINVTHTSTGTGWGFQITAIDPTLAVAGDMSAADSTTLSDRFNNGREYTNHNSPNTGNWTFNWTAPSTNVGTVTFYAAGVRITGSGNLTDRVYSTSTSLSASTPGTLQFSGAPYSQGESGSATITVSRTGGSSGAASVQFSNPAGGTATGGASCTAGVDYITPSGTLNWADGDAASKTFSVTICTDNIFEGNETVNLALSNATGATLGSPTTATLTINDDDPQPTISINDVSLAEGNSGTTSFIFTVSLSNPTTQTVNVNYATANGTATTADNDYQAIGSTLLSFSPLQTSKNVTVLVNGDTTFEADQTFFVNLSGASAATISDTQGQGTIQNDDAAPQPGTLQFSLATYSQGEAGGTATITVTRTGGSSGAASVQFSNPAGGTATGGASCTAGVDYVTPSGTLNWADADAASKTFSVTICTDNIFEGNETVNLALSNVTGATLGSQTTATLTINDDDPQPTISINDVSLAEGNSGTTSFIFTVSLSNPTTQTVNVNYATANGTATTADNDYQAIGATLLSFSPLQTSKSVTVLVNGDTTFEPDETFFVNLSGASAATISDTQGQGTIQNDDGAPQPGALQFSLATYSQGEAGGTATITVTRTGGSSGAASVQFSNPAGGTAAGGASCTAGVDYVTPAGTLNWADADAASKTFLVTICNDTIFEGNETVNLALSNATGATLGGQTTATLTINDDDFPKSKKTGVFRPSTGELFLKNSNSSGFADTLIVFGNPGDYPIAGDWNGDGTDSVGIYRSGVFYLRNTNTTGFADIIVPFGNAGDQPIVGDWNGDGVDTIGIYRNGTFYLRNSNTAGAPDLIFTLGDPGDVGIAGDWNGDGITTCGVFRPSNGIVYLRNTNTTGFADLSFVYGIAGDKPVAGDWNGDGIDTVGIYRNGQFYLTNSNTTGFADTVFALGINGDFPIAGNWNGSP